MKKPIAIGGHAHPFHYHEQKNRGSTYVCNGCQEPGFGLYYLCTGDNCHFHDHEHCGDISRRESPPISNHHPYPIGRYIFKERAPSKLQYCVACGDQVQRLSYKVRRPWFRNNSAFHPVCALFPPRMQDPSEREFQLKLEERIRGERPICEGKATGWAYNSTCRNYTYHVGCVKNKIIESWRQDEASENGGNRRRITIHVEIKLPQIEEVVAAVIQLIIGALFGFPNVADIFIVLFHPRTPLFPLAYRWHLNFDQPFSIKFHKN